MKRSEVKISYKPSYDPDDLPVVSSSREIAAILKKVFNKNTISLKEQFVIVMLNKANKVICWHTVSIGGGSGTVVDVRIVYQLALLSNANAIILSHNHPSGNLRPSEADLGLTRRIKEAGTVLDIKVLDHIILSPNGGYYSFSDEGVL